MTKIIGPNEAKDFQQDNEHYDSGLGRLIGLGLKRLAEILMDFKGTASDQAQMTKEVGPLIHKIADDREQKRS